MKQLVFLASVESRFGREGRRKGVVLSGEEVVDNINFRLSRSNEVCYVLFVHDLHQTITKEEERSCFFLSFFFLTTHLKQIS